MSVTFSAQGVEVYKFKETGLEACMRETLEFIDSEEKRGKYYTVDCYYINEWGHHVFRLKEL